MSTAQVVDRPRRTAVSAFPADLDDISERAHFPRTYLDLIVERRIDPYRDSMLARRAGTRLRPLSIPDDRLRALQKWLLHHYLNDAALAHPAAFAYVPGRRPIDAARAHLDSAWIVRVDLTGFFHSIDERMVYYALRPFGLDRLAAFHLARFVTRRPATIPGWLPEKYQTTATRPYLRSHLQPAGLGFVPQGAPTSGQVANLVAFELDVALSDLAAAHSLRYTRYADDLFLSRAADGTVDPGRGEAERITLRIQETARRLGFAPNLTKTRIMRTGTRQMVLGLLVDGPTLRLTRRVRDDLSFHLRSIETYGAQSHAEHRGFASGDALLAHLTGWINYVNEIDPARAADARARIEALTPIGQPDR